MYIHVYTSIHIHFIMTGVQNYVRVLVYARAYTFSLCIYDLYVSPFLLLLFSFACVVMLFLEINIRSK